MFHFYKQVCICLFVSMAEKTSHFSSIKTQTWLSSQMVSSHHIYISLRFIIALINFVMDLFTLSDAADVSEAEQMETELYMGKTAARVWVIDSALV